MAPRRVLRALGVCAGAIAALVFTASPAWAHVVGGAQPSNYRVQVTGVSPPAPGVEVRSGVGGEWVRLTSRGPRPVTVLGYAGEPFLRVAGGRVAVNLRSTTLADNPRLASGGQQPEPAAPPRWSPVDTGASLTWSDTRLTPQAGRGSRSAGTWTLPLRVGGSPVTVTGTWRWVPPPSPWPWVVALAAATAAVGALGWLRRPLPPVAVVLALAGLANAAHLVGLALGPHPGSAASAWATALGIGLLVWPPAVVGVVSVLRRSRHAFFAVTIAAGILALVTLLGDVRALWFSQLPFAWPAAVDRALVVATLAGGLGLGVVGVRGLRAGTGGTGNETPRTAGPDGPDPAGDPREEPGKAGADPAAGPTQDGDGG